MLFILDKLFIMFIYVTVLTAKLDFQDIPVNKAIVIAIVALSSFNIVTGKYQIPASMFKYILTVFTSILLLATFSIMMGNDFENIQQFMVPFLFLLTMPVLKGLFSSYGIDRYLYHFLVAMLILAFSVIGIFYLALNDKNIDLVINNIFVNYKISYLPAIRIFVRTGAFFSFGLLISYYFYLKKHSIFYFTLMIPMIIAIYFMQTVIIFLSTVIVLVLFFLLFDFNRLSKKILASLVFCCAIVFIIDYLGDLSLNKEESISAKSEQTAAALVLFQEKPLLGNGLGYVFRDMDHRQTTDIYLEVTYVMILATTGLAGACFYLYVYFYYPVKYYFSKRRQMSVIMLFLAHFSIMLNGLSNPYIFSGTMGLLFIVMAAALMESDRKERLVY